MSSCVKQLERLNTLKRTIMNKLYSQIIFFFLFPLFSYAQICTGNLGDNIFEEGDFGSGSSNNVLENPNIAPGYTYTTNSPSDGFYILTNNTGAWSNLYGTWLSLRDNSSDPNGYMMVVNASFEQGDFYKQTIEGLCENTLYIFTADIINIVKQNVSDHHPPNVSFLLNDEVLYNTGDILQTERWNTYGFTFTTTEAQESLTLTLRNNAPGGIGNDLALDNITFRPCGPEALILPLEIANICEDGDPIQLDATVEGTQYETPVFQWQRSFDEGETWEDMSGENNQNIIHTDRASGFYYYRYLLANDENNLANSKCRVNSNIKIVHVVPKFYEITDTLCQGLTFEVGNSSYKETGVYVDSLLSSLNCDSIVTLNLTIIPDQGIEANTNVLAPSCATFADGEIRIDNLRNFYPPFRIDMQGELPDSTGVFRDLAAGNYAATIEDYFGCLWSENIQIVDPEKFIIDLGGNLKIDLGDSIQLSLKSNYDFSNLNWQPKDALLCESNCLNEAWFPRQSDTYTLSATSEFGCFASDSIKVVVVPKRKVYVPNAFSPSGNNANQRFTIFGATPNVQRILQLQIFDRWGNLLFEQIDFPPNSLEHGWNGTSPSGKLQNGTYIFVAKVLFLDEQIRDYSGEVVLLESD